VNHRWGLNYKDRRFWKGKKSVEKRGRLCQVLRAPTQQRKGIRQKLPNYSVVKTEDFQRKKNKRWKQRIRNNGSLAWVSITCAKRSFKAKRGGEEKRLGKIKLDSGRGRSEVC